MYRVLITGGTGSWGNELTKQLLESNNPPAEIVIFSRGELAQVNMQRKFNNPKLKFIIGDIRDFDAINFACREVDWIFHLAALKHVPVCEELPQEAIKTNIQGTVNVINAAINNKVRKVIDVSTDKSVNPFTLYGMTKAVAERLVIQGNHLSNITKLVCVRGGNVLGSNGSVVPYFIDQIKKFNKVQITHPNMTRFFLTIPEAISLLFVAAHNSVGGETFVMKMPACNITNLAEVIKKHYGNNDTKIEYIGLRPGEKIREQLISEYEAPISYEFNENYYLILPTLPTKELTSFYRESKLSKLNMKVYDSSCKLMNNDEIEIMLRKGGFLPE